MGQTFNLADVPSPRVDSPHHPQLLLGRPLRPEPGSWLEICDTQTFAIPWRPECDSTCADAGYGAGFAWRASDGKCYNGFAFNVVFDFGQQNVVVPNEIIFGIAYDTSDYGYNPLRSTNPSGGPYDSLNVGLREGALFGPPSIGTDVEPTAAFQYSTWAGNYCDNGAGGIGVFRRDAPCWADSPYGELTPAIQFSTIEMATPKPPSGSTLVLDLKYHVINDEDSGFVGYWALDHYAKHIMVWKTPSGPKTYYAFITYDGGWHTFAGALSPQNGVRESRDGAGNYNGFLEFTFTADSNTPFTGNLPTKDYGGTQADILLGSYGSQTGPTNVFHWTSVYFTSFGNEVDLSWAFYYYKGNKLGWTNTYSGSFGDIVV